jgi:hypothetical protein
MACSGTALLSYGIKNYGIEVPLKGITSLRNLMKIYKAVQKFIWGQTDIQTAWSSHKPISGFGK